MRTRAWRPPRVRHELLRRGNDNDTKEGAALGICLWSRPRVGAWPWVECACRNRARPRCLGVDVPRELGRDPERAGNASGVCTVRFRRLAEVALVHEAHEDQLRGAALLLADMGVFQGSGSP